MCEKMQVRGSLLQTPDCSHVKGASASKVEFPVDKSCTAFHLTSLVKKEFVASMQIFCFIEFSNVNFHVTYHGGLMCKHKETLYNSMVSIYIDPKSRSNALWSLLKVS